MAAATNPLSYNAYIQQMGVLAVYGVQNVAGVDQFVDAPIELSIPNMLNYAELRIQRDLDMLATRTNNLYTLTIGVATLSLPVDDFIVIETLKIKQDVGPVDPAVSGPMVPVSLEYMQNVYGTLSTPGTPRFFCMYGSDFGDNSNTQMNIVINPIPDYAYQVFVTGIARAPSLYKSASAGPADTAYTYISSYYPDLLTMASMIYITMLQRNFGAVGDSPEMGMTYEKQYQALRIGAIQEENRRKQMGSAWSGYSTPVSATPTR